jgi:DNA topoisomerase VI subunit B
MLTRTTFETSRALEFFSERELIMQMGFERRAWPIALLKELLDNALDACESAGVAPEIAVCTDGATLTVEDNGPGLPVDTLERSLDYTIRVSDKAHYVSPSRGQLGNALKCVWAAPYVLQPSRPARVDVTTQGTRYQLDVHLDPLAQAPQLTLTAHPAAMIKSGTAITMHWPVEPKLSVVILGAHFLSSVRLAPRVRVVQSPRTPDLSGGGDARLACLGPHLDQMAAQPSHLAALV